MQSSCAQPESSRHKIIVNKCKNQRFWKSSKVSDKSGSKIFSLHHINMHMFNLWAHIHVVFICCVLRKCTTSISTSTSQFSWRFQHWCLHKGGLVRKTNQKWQTTISQCKKVSVKYYVMSDAMMRVKEI